jgi:hypothetical protein
MKAKHLVKAAFCALAIAASAWASAVPRYTVELIQTPADTTASAALRVNNLGDCVGYWARALEATYFFKPHGMPLTAIPVPGGGQITDLTGLNDAGQVIGTSTVGAFVWRSADGGWTTLQPPAGYVRAVPTSINGRGTLVGYVTIENEDDVPLNRRAFTWTQAEGMRIVRSGRALMPAALNDKGKMAVTAYYDGNPDFGNEALFVQQKEGYQRLGDLGASSNAMTSIAVDVNAQGQVTGMVDDVGALFADTFLWSSKLGKTVPVVPSSKATGITDSGDIVGNITSSVPAGYVWSAETKEWFYLADRLAPKSPVLTYVETLDVSPNGIVAGLASVDSVSSVAMILTPVPEIVK